jgi:hypothetical protein
MSGSWLKLALVLALTPILLPLVLIRSVCDWILQPLSTNLPTWELM